MRWWDKARCKVYDCVCVSVWVCECMWKVDTVIVWGVGVWDTVGVFVYTGKKMCGVASHQILNVVWN